jgi:CheY-like chemotaxis protein
VAVETKATARPADGAYPGVDLHQSVLVVEEATLAVEMLSGLGYEVTRVASAPAALARLENGHAVDLVFCDVTLPGGMNGLDLARELKRRHPNLAIVLTTGYSDALRSNASTEGLQMLPKPYPIASRDCRPPFVRRLRQVRSRRARRRGQRRIGGSISLDAAASVSRFLTPDRLGLNHRGVLGHDRNDHGEIFIPWAL